MNGGVNYEQAVAIMKSEGVIIETIDFNNVREFREFHIIDYLKRKQKLRNKVAIELIFNNEIEVHSRAETKTKFIFTYKKT